MLVTLDGYFEGLNHDLSWHQPDAEFHEYCHAQNSRVDTLLFGHRTYDLMANFWPTPQGEAIDPPTAKFMNEAPKIVVSKQLLKPEWNNTGALSTDVVEAVRRLKAEPGQDIAIFGSNKLGVSLMTERLVDEFRLMVSPVAIGRGTPLFTGYRLDRAC